MVRERLALSDRSVPASTDTERLPVMLTEPLLSTVISVLVRSRLMVSLSLPLAIRTPCLRPPVRWLSRSTRLPWRSDRVCRTAFFFRPSCSGTSLLVGTSRPL